MKSRLTNNIRYSPYPGEYTPMPRAQALLAQLKKQKEYPDEEPLAYIEECGDCYKVEMNVPGVTRQDIFINVYTNILSVIILQMSYDDSENKNQYRSFDNRSMERHFLLPPDADPEFVSAEYRNGVLCMHIPKSEDYATSYTKSIAVY